jgi:putative tryptophan/tyrosine transport system substrate-binding protein
VTRRDLIALLGSTAATWPLGARAQQPERMRRIGVLMTVSVDDLDQQNGLAAFVQALQQLGWTDGRNVRIDTRWGAGEVSAIRRHADDLIALSPDVIAAVDQIRIRHQHSRALGIEVPPGLLAIADEVIE